MFPEVKKRYTDSTMTIRKILTSPDPRLFVVTRRVTSFDLSLETLIQDMFETMYATDNGVGLAATQIGEDVCVAVIDVSPQRNEPLVLVNPEILEKRDMIYFKEGCLSVPFVDDKVERANWIRFAAQDHRGVRYEREAEGLLAECVQHEYDHLQGKLYYHFLSHLKRDRLIKRYQKILKENNN